MCECVFLCACSRPCACAWIGTWTVCVRLLFRKFVSACAYVRMCMHVCMHIRMYVCKRASVSVEVCKYMRIFFKAEVYSEWCSQYFMSLGLKNQPKEPLYGIFIFLWRWCSWTVSIVMTTGQLMRRWRWNVKVIETIIATVHLALACGKETLRVNFFRTMSKKTEPKKKPSKKVESERSWSPLTDQWTRHDLQWNSVPASLPLTHQQVLVLAIKLIWSM